jgi:hypothetical protein
MSATPRPDPSWTSPFEELLHAEFVMPSEPLSDPAVQRPPALIGTPIQDAAFWEGPQQYPDDCAIKCQQFILEQFTGMPADEHTLVREAWEHGWYMPGRGMFPQDVGQLLELHGVGVHRYDHASIFHLTSELAQGHKVIVGVDAKELWQGSSLLEEICDALGFAEANHAVVVSGIDTSDPDHVRVVVSDPGTGQACAVYPLEQFLDAWGDSNFFLVATNDPAPPHLPEMAHFDYQRGHLPQIADCPYDQFLTFADHLQDWDNWLHQYVQTYFLCLLDDSWAADLSQVAYLYDFPGADYHDLLPDLSHLDASDLSHLDASDLSHLDASDLSHLDVPGDHGDLQDGFFPHDPL